MRAIAHPELELSGTTLSDSTLGTHYFLTPDAAWLFLQLQQEPRIEYLVPIVAREQQIAQAEAKQAVYTLLGLLNSFGGVRMHWEGAFGSLLRLKARSAWRRRYPGTVTGFVGSMLCAYGYSTAAVTSVFLVCRIVLGPAFSLAWSAAVVSLLGSCVLHEAGHALAARIHSVPFVFLARTSFAAIMYRRPGGRQARLIALCGPLVAVLFCVVMAWVSAPVIMRYLFVTAGLIHACSLLPFLADGRTLWRKYDE